jgi:hypothetical protein
MLQLSDVKVSGGRRRACATPRAVGAPDRRADGVIGTKIRFSLLLTFAASRIAWHHR